jgi:hypothetical protein
MLARRFGRPVKVQKQSLRSPVSPRGEGYDQVLAQVPKSGARFHGIGDYMILPPTLSDAGSMISLAINVIRRHGTTGDGAELALA